MKKHLFLSLFAVLAFGVVGLASCGPQEDPNSDPNVPNNPNDPNDPGKTDDDEEYDLIYRSWDLSTAAANNEERQLVARFEELYDVNVKIVENPGSGNTYWTNIQASTMNNIDYADVMMIPNLDWPLAAGYLLDISEYVENDEDFAKVPESIRSACTFKSGTYALPARMNLQGYFMNVDLVEDWNINPDDITVNSEFDVIENIIEEGFTHVREGQIGLDTTTHWIDTQASVFNTDTSVDMGYFTWDGSEYHLDSPAFTRSVQEAKRHYSSKHTLDAYTPEERVDIFNVDPEAEAKVDLWNRGGLALRYGYTYEIPDMVSANDQGNLYRFIGNPGGKITIVGDYYGIAKNSKNPQLAYQFAKFMSFGKEGFEERMDVYASGESGTINTLPLTNDQDVIDEYFDLFNESTGVEGLREAFELIQTESMVEGVKIVPGFLQARQNKKTGVNIGTITNASMFELLNACVTGTGNIADYVTGTTNIDTIADTCYQDWLDKNGAQYN